MINKDIYGKPLSNTFLSAIDAYAQKVKPKILVTFLDSRHVDNLTVTTNDPYPSNSRGTYAQQMSGNSLLGGYFFKPEQSMNGTVRQAYTWAVIGDKDNMNKVIRADGTWHCMPSDLEDNYEFGWRSYTASTANAHANGGYEFTTPITLDYNFTERKVNKIRVTTSEFSGKISAYKIEVYNNTLSAFYNTYSSISVDDYYNEHILPSNISNDVSRILLTIYSTQNPNDYARVHEVEPIYEVDITDYAISHSVNRQGELWENSIPIAGTGSSSATITLDNTTRAFNPFDNSSLYGKYMKKDLKIKIYNGWRIVKTDDVIVNTQLMSNITSVSNTITVSDASKFLNGNATNTFTLIIEPNTPNEEIILCSTRTDVVVDILERGYANTIARSHSSGATVSFDPYEYVNAGEFYVDEWTGGTSMEVSVKCLDKSKFLTEKQITKGFYVQNSTVGDAIEKMLMSINISKNEYIQIKPYTNFAKENAILLYSFDTPIQRDETSILLNQGLRYRIWKIAVGKENEVKDIKADALDVILSKYDKAMGAKAYIPPTYVGYDIDVSDPLNPKAVNLSNYSFVEGSNTHSEYYNGVIDGYFIPPATSGYNLNITTINSGVRAFIDDTLVLDTWTRLKTNTDTISLSSYDYLGDNIDLDAGVPYKIRIEFYHAEGPKDSGKAMTLRLGMEQSSGAASNYAASPASQFTTVVAKDYVGSRNSTFATVTSSSPYAINKNLKNRNHYQNDAVYVNGPTLNQVTGLVSEPNNKSVLVGKVTRNAINYNTYIRIPYSESLNLANNQSSNFTDEWTIELYVKLPYTFSNSGEYVSNWNNSSSTSGFEFFNTSSSNGFRVVKNNGDVKTVSSNTALSTTQYSHIVAKHTDGAIHYYVNGVKLGQTDGVGTQASWVNDITIGGRGASFSAGAEVAPSTVRDFYIDEFAMYNRALTDDEVLNRYISTQIRELSNFPHLYGNEQSAKAVVDAITLADFGRFYVDEENKFKYIHFYRYFESSISQHANVQKTISSNSHIISGDYNVQLQTNKVTINVTEQNPLISNRQGIWTATPDPSTLGVVKLTSNITSSSNTIPVTTTDRPPFPTSGYIKIDQEIMKYESINSTNFLSVTRGEFDTTPVAHYANDLVREVRYYDIKYDNAPAFNIQKPFITSISNTYPARIELVRFSTGPYNAQLILAASSSVPEGELAFIQGTNPQTQEVNYTSIAGTPVIKQSTNNLIKKQTATLSDDIRKYGLKEVVIDNEYIYSAAKAQQIADFLISKFATPVPVLQIDSMAIPILQIGDRIRISDFTSLNISNTDYWVVSHDLNVGETLDHKITLRKVV
jgi:hypothetical protein